ncbi:hypothetical protein CHLNCDRAFT_136983 [Chlorella variabilis]|uniref:Uncharacterized protein n=1 Tax=Chlorella variabilis TaxID=554065 RepID=E1ZLQ9_CHLVA|nr:hypothetical protein CHLNCDRAFT_136983 [Chlorella variabilis]EFN53176.1 hypothetical protein CHLNCDRAFT_136983 [Chlorella variabilis]|eukprot:XP_005845278.1 hypothetical protein CHLNCDRAFT_136983 [Chlorella variabilis]
MSSLWASSDAAQWQEALDGYWQAVEGLGKPRLSELDRWFHEQLPGDLQGRQPPHLTQPELVKLVDWKLTRGKSRPRLLAFAKEAAPAAVQAASTAAFDLLAPHRGREAPPAAVKEALAALTVLKGVGPATASAVLEAYEPSIPFSSDQAMLAALDSKDYTVAKVLELMAALRAKAKQLSEGGGRQWTSRELEMALYAATVSSAASGGGGKAASGGGGGGGKAASVGGGNAAASAAGAKGAKRKR